MRRNPNIAWTTFCLGKSSRQMRLGGGLGGLAAARAVARGDGQHLVLPAALVLPPLASSLKFGLLRSAGVGTAARWFCLAGRQGCSGGFRRLELLGRWVL